MVPAVGRRHGLDRSLASVTAAGEQQLGGQVFRRSARLSRTTEEVLRYLSGKPRNTSSISD